jgi:FrmR/RcnR family transcriptional regulator, repressor of rcnA expression
MAHTIKDKQKLINRVRRIRGQVEAIEKALAEEQECSLILQTIAASRGAIDGPVGRGRAARSTRRRPRT